MKANAPKRKVFQDAVDLLGMPEEVNVPVSNGQTMIPTEKIVPFHNHPFRLYEGERLADMVESIKEHGVLNPVIVQKVADKYEMLAGHNRWNAAKIAGVSEIPAIVKDGLSKEEAYVYVIETNLMQRSFTDLLPSEKAAVLAERYEKVMCQGKRNDILEEIARLNGVDASDTCGHDVHKSKNRDSIGEDYGMTGRNIARYMRLNQTTEQIKEMVDEGTMAIISHAEGHKRGIASNHGDPEHLWRQLDMGYTMDGFRKDVKAAMTEKVSGMQATEFVSLSETEVIAKVGALFTADQKKSGILASVSLAQFILESGYGKSELAQNANNCFGMKKSLSGNTWSGSVWDGKSAYTKQTKEQNTDGSYETITADFRKYACVEDSIADHSAYLLGAMNGNKKRYEGIAGMADYKKVVQLIKDGGYATSLTYVEKLCSIIEKWNLTQYDVKETATEPEKWYRVRKSWGDAKSQKGAYKVLKNAKACADKNEGYSVYDWNGNVVYVPSKSSEPEQKKVSYRVRVSIKNLNIRKGPGTHFAKTGAYTGVGVFTIVAESVGLGSEKGWGKLKSGAGWISLDYAKKI